jgi:hypothetical protein
MGRRQGNITIEIDGTSPLFDKTGLDYQEFPSDYSKIRYYSRLVVRSAPQRAGEIRLLEQQVSEIIKNAIKHGNKNDPQKKVRIWHKFTPHMARLIVEDEGEGFRELEEWNTLNLKRSQHIYGQNYDELEKYVSFQTSGDDDVDGGNALFAAVEYWDAGMVFNEKRNAVAMKKLFKGAG